MVDKTEIVIDVTHFVSWFSLLKVTQVFREMKSHDILEVRGADTDTREDLFKILPKSAYQILTIDREDDDGFHQFQIQKQETKE